VLFGVGIEGGHDTQPAPAPAGLTGAPGSSSLYSLGVAACLVAFGGTFRRLVASSRPSLGPEAIGLLERKPCPLLGFAPRLSLPPELL
jgi:hypothetical protein